MNAKTTYSKISQNVAKFMIIFSVKKQRTNAKCERSKGRGQAISRRRKIYAMIGVELRPCG